MDLFAMIDEAAALGTTVFQICDYPAVESMSDDELASIRVHSDERGIELELGTRGVSEAHLQRYLDMATMLDATFVRTMLHVPDHQPDTAEAIKLLSSIIPAHADRGVTLGLETYEQVATEDLVAVVGTIGSPFLGICLDPANSVARLEMPSDVIAACAPWVVNVHVKDFSFTRAAGLVGFTLVGCPLGTGLLPYEAMMEAVRPHDRGVNLIVEHWVPPAGSLEETCEIESEWTAHSVAFLAADA
jgi:sugar phosphate isomerase/epimerase